MTRGARILLAAALLAPVAPLAAQSAAPAEATPPAPGPRALPPAPAAAADPSLPERRVIEDDQVRIEEVRVRGLVRSVTVQSKLGGARPYEIDVGRPGRDPSIHRGAAGQSRWSLLDF